MYGRRIHEKLRKNQRGAALVEFALVVSLLIVLLFGIIDYSLLLKDYLALGQVGREAVRMAAVGRQPDFNTLATRFGLDSEPEKFTAKMEPADPVQGDQITVTLSYRHDMIIGVLEKEKALTSSTVMRRE